MNAPPPVPAVLTPGDRALIGAVQVGLPLVNRPYASVAEDLGWTEAAVIERIEQLLAAGVIKRWGVVVRHRELGYRANAMAVWDAPDAQVDELGQALSQFEFVTLCYRRQRHPPDWPYNLFCMIHGRSRAAVRAQLGGLIDALRLHALPHALLFSQRCFKQRGARYADGGPERFDGRR